MRDAPYGNDIEALAASHADQTRRFGSAGLAIGGIVGGAVQCILAPRLAILGALAADPAAERAVARGVVDIATVELRLRVSAALPPEAITALGAALGSMRDDGTAEAIEARASRPVLFARTGGSLSAR